MRPPSTARSVPNTAPDTSGLAQSSLKQGPPTTKVLQDATAAVPDVSTSLSTTDENVTLDIRWTVLCDLSHSHCGQCLQHTFPSFVGAGRA